MLYYNYHNRTLDELAIWQILDKERVFAVAKLHASSEE
jgi:hypothetical protein